MSFLGEQTNQRFRIYPAPELAASFHRAKAGSWFATRWCLAAIVWALAVAVGWFLLTSYGNTSGIAAEPPKHWPSGSHIPLNPAIPTLVLFVHPHCPCTRATLEELERLVARSPDALATWVVFCHPATAPDNWSDTTLWKTASAIPSVHVLSDTAAIETRRFHATTSGQAVLYGADGSLLFSGGITWARGHAGDNAGRSAIESCLTTGQSASTRTPVFGCSLFTASEER